MLAVQVFLESLALADPSVPPEGADDTKGLVKCRVNLEDDERNEVTNLFHNT